MENINEKSPSGLLKQIERFNIIDDPNEGLVLVQTEPNFGTSAQDMETTTQAVLYCQLCYISYII